MSWVYIRMFLKAVKGGRLNSRTPNTSTELSVNLVDSLISLKFLDCRAEMCIHSHEEFLCQYEFQLSLSFSRQNKELETKSRRFVCFNFTLKFCSTWSYKQLKFEWFRLIHVKERKMKNWTKILVKKQKDQWKSPVTGKRSVSKCSNRRTTKLLWAMRQRKYFRTRNKNNLDIDTYLRCLTQRNCKSLKVM